MTQEKPLHIVNGQVMYDFFQRTNFLEHERMIPFNEAMCYGKTCKDLFSKEFSEIRAKVHHVTLEQYSDITLNPLQPLLNQNFTSIELWFDEDMFCQINVLTILAWLDQIEYKNNIDLHLVDENLEPAEKFSLNAEGYFPLYNQVLIEKTMPEDISPPPLKKGVELYLNYLNPDSSIMQYIKNNPEVPNKRMVGKLLKNFKEYGLGDTQYFEIVENYRR